MILPCREIAGRFRVPLGGFFEDVGDRSRTREQAGYMIIIIIIVIVIIIAIIIIIIIIIII